MKRTAIFPVTVEFIPPQLEEGILYISEKYRTCSHLCACGCGEKVVTPLSRAEWQIQRVGDLVSLNPSIGNWNYACQSHYYINQNRIRWSGKMTSKQIQRVKLRDANDMERMVAFNNAVKGEVQVSSEQKNVEEKRAKDRQTSSLLATVIGILKKIFQR